MRQPAKYVLILLGVILLFAKLVFDLVIGSTSVLLNPPISNDFINQWWPVYELAGAAVRSGQIPFWNPYMSMGSPLLAEIGLGFFYPINWLVFLLDVPFALLLIQLLTVLIGVAGMLLYTSYLGLSWPARILTAGLFAYAVFTNSFMPSLGSSYCWFPLILWCVHQLIDRPCSKSMLYLTFVLALCFMAGFPNFFYYSCLLAGLYFFVLLCFSWRDFGLGGSLQRMVLFALAVALMLGLVAIQLLPTHELSTLSVRDVESSLQFNKQSLFENYSLASILKNYLRTDTANVWALKGFSYPSGIYYLGGTLLLLPFAWMSKRYRPVVTALGLAFIFFLMFILSRQVPLLSFLQKIPLAESLRFHSRGIDYAQFFLIVGSGVGISYLSGLSSKDEQWPSRLFVLSYFAYALAIIVATTMILGNAWQFSSVLFCGLLLLAAIMFQQSSLRISDLPWSGIAWSLVVIILIDVSVHRKNYFPTPYFLASEQVGSGYLNRENKKFFSDIEKIKSSADYSRVVFVADDSADTYESESTQKLSNIGSKYQFFNLNAYHGFSLARWRNMVEMIVGKDEFERNNSKSLLKIFYGSLTTSIIDSMLREPELTGMTSLKYFIFPDAQVENVHALPRVYTVSDYLVTSSEEESLAAIKKGKHNLRNLVVLEGASPIFAPTSTLVSAPERQNLAKIEHYFYNEVQLRVQVQEPSMLVLTDSYYPGWQAFVDGERVQIYRANSLFRAVEVPPGDHQVVFLYRPMKVYWGLAISFISLLIVMALSLFSRYGFNPSRLKSAGRH